MSERYVYTRKKIHAHGGNTDEMRKKIHAHGGNIDEMRKKGIWGKHIER